MCGIFATQLPGGAGGAGALVLEGLQRLDYRGYDSAGVAVALPEGLCVARAVGPVGRLVAVAPAAVRRPDARTAVGHTRWATHGAVTVANAHPFLDCTGRCAVVHNGVLDNAAQLRQELEQSGHRFRSQVDSEVLAHLLEDALETAGEPVDALRGALSVVEGTWAVAALVGGRLLVARRASPLLVRGGAGEVVVASDAAALGPGAGPLRVLDDGDVADLSAWAWRRADGSTRPPAEVAVRIPAQDAEPPRGTALEEGEGGDRMLREIAEQPDVVAGLVEAHLPGVLSGATWRGWGLPAVRRVRFVACGSSRYAAQVAASALRQLAQVEAEVRVASEVEGPGRPVDLTVAVSQSGETADVLRALEVATGPVAAITNVPWSSLGRRADVVLECRAGTERGVAATKTFTAQVVCGVLLALAAAGRGERLPEGLDGHARALTRLPEQLSRADLTGARLAPDLVRPHLSAPGWLFLGAGEALPYAAEGALKLSELAYRFAGAHPVGELKHGPLALVESGTPVVLVDGLPRTRVAASVAEVRSRGGCVLRVGGPGSDVPVLTGPVPAWGPLPAVVALQHLARALAGALGHDVDRPRNLAKSVTVA